MGAPSTEGFEEMKNIVFLLLLLLLQLLMNVAVGGRTNLKNLDNLGVKSIQSENGDTIDCVNIYKQPAFNHPLLQNHTIQMKPSFHLKKFANNSMPNAWPVQQLWQKSGSCPEGTIPIRRSREADLIPSSPRIESTEVITIHAKTFCGANARLNVWKVNAEPKEFSLNYVKISSNQERNLVEAGWGAYPALFGDDQTRIYCYWMAVGQVETGCYNLQCPGFVQVNWKIALGSSVSPLSTYNADQRYVDMCIIKDNVHNNWWLHIAGEPIGYWPQSIFTELRAGSTITWGGSVSNVHTNGRHTTTQLGSGHPSQEGYSRAAFMADVLSMPQSGEWEIPTDDYHRESHPSYYNMTWPEVKPDLGYSFFYGGPGSQTLA